MFNIYFLKHSELNRLLSLKILALSPSVSLPERSVEPERALYSTIHVCLWKSVGSCRLPESHLTRVGAYLCPSQQTISTSPLTEMHIFHINYNHCLDHNFHSHHFTYLGTWKETVLPFGCINCMPRVGCCQGKTTLDGGSSITLFSPNSLRWIWFL